MVTVNYGQAQLALAAYPRQLLRIPDQHSSGVLSLHVPRSCRQQVGQQRAARVIVSAAVMAPNALKTYTASEMSASHLLEATARPRIDFGSILNTVGAELLQHVPCQYR